MGLLDDAIREHLDLKRRRGADPSEIERAEREALGPVRREPEPLQAPQYDEEQEFGEPEHEAARYAADEPIELQQPELGPDPDEGDRVGSQFEPEMPLPHGVVGPGATQPPVDEPVGAHEEDHWADEPGGARGHAEPHGHPVSGAAPPPGGYDQETVEYRVEHPADPHGEDVLEETPEFLQDTPDHDRLWFEQRPPRDFDFDK